MSNLKQNPFSVPELPPFKFISFEVHPGERVFAPTYPTMPNNLLTVGEVEALRDFLNIVIANPRNFQFVSPEPVLHVSPVLTPRKTVYFNPDCAVTNGQAIDLCSCVVCVCKEQ